MESNRGIGRGRFFESGISEKPKCNIGSTDGASSTSTCADGERPIGRGRLLQHLTILKKVCIDVAHRDYITMTYFR